MEKAVKEITALVEELLGNDRELGMATAHDFVSELALEMEVLTKERMQLEKKLDAIAADRGDRSALVEEIAARIEKVGGRARFTREIIDEVIERMFGLEPEEILILKNNFKKEDE